MKNVTEGECPKDTTTTSSDEEGCTKGAGWPGIASASILQIENKG